MQTANRIAVSLFAGVGLVFLSAGGSAADQKGVDPENLGQITGEVRYPSCDGSAPGLEICASSLKTDVEVCTQDLLPDVRGALTYVLEVPAGRYVVFARTPVVKDGRYRAYYSEAVRCGLYEQCDDHTPIPVVVKGGETSAGVHPADWVAGLQPSATPLRL